MLYVRLYVRERTWKSDFAKYVERVLNTVLPSLFSHLGVFGILLSGVGGLRSFSRAGCCLFAPRNLRILAGVLGLPMLKPHAGARRLAYAHSVKQAI